MMMIFHIHSAINSNERLQLHYTIVRGTLKRVRRATGSGGVKPLSPRRSGCSSLASLPPRGSSPLSRIRMVEGNMLSTLFKVLMKILTAPLWFFDAVDKEKMVLAIPFDIRRRVLKLMFLPTLWWTMLLHRTMPDQRRWYDRVDSRVIIGALPLKSHLETLSRIERVSGVINFCDEFAGHAEYGKVGMRQLRLPTLDYCSPTVQQLEKGLDFIRNQPPGCSTYVHCKAGRGRAGTMLMAYLISERGMSPDMAQRELLRVRPHVSPRLWKRQSVRELYRRKKIQMQEEERERAILEAQERAKLEEAPSLVDGSARVSESPFESEVETTGPTDQPASTSEGAPPIN